MAHTWRYAFGLGLVGAALSLSCTVTSDDDSGTGAQAGESSGGTGGTGGKGGSGGTGGSTGGTTGGSSGKGGSTTGGSAGAATGGTAGATGGAGGTGGSTSGTGGSTAGTGGSTGGTGGDMVVPTCDPIDGTHPYDSCAPAMGYEDDPCAQCQQKSCCDEVKSCRSYDPNNVCSWGGPLPGEDYAGAGEIGCMLTCMTDYVATNEVCDTEGIDYCTGKCTTAMCGIPGNSTSDLFGCIKDNCADKCFSTDKVMIDTCG